VFGATKKAPIAKQNTEIVLKTDDIFLFFILIASDDALARTGALYDIPLSINKHYYYA
jgi:hypothetical protein